MIAANVFLFINKHLVFFRLVKLVEERKHFCRHVWHNLLKLAVEVMFAYDRGVKDAFAVCANTMTDFDKFPGRELVEVKTGVVFVVTEDSNFGVEDFVALLD